MIGRVYLGVAVKGADWVGLGAFFLALFLVVIMAQGWPDLGSKGWEAAAALGTIAAAVAAVGMPWYFHRIQDASNKQRDAEDVIGSLRRMYGMYLRWERLAARLVSTSANDLEAELQDLLRFAGQLDEVHASALGSALTHSVMLSGLIDDAINWQRLLIAAASAEQQSTRRQTRDTEIRRLTKYLVEKFREDYDPAEQAIAQLKSSTRQN